MCVCVFIDQFHCLFKKIFTSIRREFLLCLTLLATFATWSMCDQWGPWLGRVKLRLPWFSRWCWAELPVVSMPFFPAHAPLLLAAGRLAPFLIGSISCCIHCPCVLHVNSLKLVFLLASSNRKCVFHELLRQLVNSRVFVEDVLLIFFFFNRCWMFVIFSAQDAKKKASQDFKTQNCQKRIELYMTLEWIY